MVALALVMEAVVRQFLDPIAAYVGAEEDNHLRLYAFKGEADDAASSTRLRSGEWSRLVENDELLKNQM